MSKKILSVGLAVVFAACVGLSTAAAASEQLAKVVAGAQKEGTAVIKTVHGFTEKSMYRLEQGIKDKFGVSIKIRYTGATNFNQDVVKARMEQKTGVVPSFDMITLSNHVVSANKAGVLEKVDWKPLLTPGTSPQAVHDNPLMVGAIVYTTGHMGLMYNPTKVKAEEVPKKLAGLADPKWKNKIGVETRGSASVRWAYLLGIDKTMDTYRKILQNGAIHGMSYVQYNRYLIEEIWMARVTSTFMASALKAGAPAAWQSQDISDISEFSAVIRKGAAHANAAKLVALYLASPEGVKFGNDIVGYGNLYYPGNFEHDIRMQDQKQGIPEVFGCRKTDLLEFYTSKAGRKLRKDLGLLMETSGTHKTKKKK